MLRFLPKRLAKVLTKVSKFLRKNMIKTLCFRSLALIVAVLMNLLKTESSFNRKKFFKAANLFIWPLGVVVASLQYIHVDGYLGVQYYHNYLFSASCQPAFTFELANHASECILGKAARAIYIIYYTVMLFFTFATMATFIPVAVIIFHKWNFYRKLAKGFVHLPEEAIAFRVASGHQKSVMKSSFPFAISGLVYIFIYAPVAVTQMYMIFHGPAENSDAFQFFVSLLRLCKGDFIATINIVFYVFISSGVRREVRDRMSDRAARVGKRIKALGSDCNASQVSDHRHLTFNSEYSVNYDSSSEDSLDHVEPQNMERYTA